MQRTTAYSYRLRLSDGGTLTARSVLITTGVSEASDQSAWMIGG